MRITEDDSDKEIYESEEPDESNTGIVEPYQFEPLAETSATDTDSLNSETEDSQNQDRQHRLVSLSRIDFDIVL